LAEPIESVCISHEDFRRLLANRACRLCSCSSFLIHNPPAQRSLSRPLVGTLLSQATQIEELLDAYRARNNTQWHDLRSLVAAIKAFANVSYILLHIKHVLPNYRLLPIERNFERATDDALTFTGGVLADVCGRFLRKAEGLEVACFEDQPDESLWTQGLPPGRLPHDRADRRLEDVPKTVTALATAFLNLAAESEILHSAGRSRPEEHAQFVPEPISEKSLSNLQHRFHSLQSLYDTYVNETETESLDPDLPVLRGHISVVFHLLEAATAFAHYYERHVARGAADGHPLVEPDKLLSVLMQYSISYASQYVTCARGLCQSMLKMYAEVGEITVPVPRYRGFHVRPSTLVSKIVLHYGSEVRMVMEGEEYDASTPFEIFRANEKINAKKRKWLALEIANLPHVLGEIRTDNAQAVARQVVRHLADQGKVVIYDRPLKMPEEPVGTTGTMLVRVVDELARLQATGKIDIAADLNITFVGDQRVLSDIALLAENGYGEDNMGNNIRLPDELSYLRR
jgi:hypothetical protein